MKRRVSHVDAAITDLHCAIKQNGSMNINLPGSGTEFTARLLGKLRSASDDVDFIFGRLTGWSAECRLSSTTKQRYFSQVSQEIINDTSNL